MAYNIGKIFPPKDPSDTRKVTIDWSAYLRTGATISAASTPTVPTGITCAATSFDSTSTTHTLTGGTAGEDYEIEARISTSDGEQLDVAFTVPVL